MNRRQFLTTLTAGALIAPHLSFAATRPATSAHYFSARADRDGRYYVSGFDADGHAMFSTQLPSRGHGLAVHPTLNHVTAVARRPETYLIVLDGSNGEIIHSLQSTEGRHFYGHSIYSNDGRWLYTAENNVETGDGLIGVRDVQNGYRQVAEYSAYGIGPHELNMLSDGKTLVVAVGGILTKPETGRSKLNIDTMSPSLTYIDSHTGELLEQRKLPQDLHQNSIRHFAVNADDEVCFAMQYQGSKQDRPQLVGLHRRGEEIQLMAAPNGTLDQMHNYCGSVCSDTSSHWFAVSSPKGNLVTFWSAKEARFVGSVEIKDGCGIAAGNANGEFLLSSGAGGVYRYHVGDQQLIPLKEISALDTRWDNHISKQII